RYSHFGSDEYRLVGEHTPPILPDTNNVQDVADFLDFYRRTDKGGHGQKQLLSLLKTVGDPKRITEHPIVAMREAGWGAKGAPLVTTELHWLAAVLAEGKQLTDSNPFKGGHQRLDQLMQLTGAEGQIAKLHMADRFTFLTFKAHANPRQDAIALLLPEQFCTPQIMAFFSGEPPVFPNITVFPLDGSADLKANYADFYYRVQQGYQFEDTGDHLAIPDIQQGKQIIGRPMSPAQSDAPTLVDGQRASREDPLLNRLEKDRISFNDRREIRGILDSVQGNPIALARQMLDMAREHYRTEALMVDPRPEVEAQRGKKIAEAQALLDQADRQLHETEALLMPNSSAESETVVTDSAITQDVGKTQPVELPPSTDENDAQAAADQSQVRSPSEEQQRVQAKHIAKLRGSKVWIDAFTAPEGGEQLNVKSVKRVILDALPPHLQHLPEYFQAMQEWEIVQAHIKRAK
ncbi:MAG: hypothetical protein KGL95_03550, partial [Patescibacteria group bacterium]|nr:hypothetical protein [Patescibacteria group bacterium]